MNPFVLTRSLEPWRLWTCHVVHFGPGHAFLNLAALAIPFALVPAARRRRMALGLVLVAPLLSLALLPFLGSGQYRGASGLACAAWSMAGLHLLRDRGTRLEGALVLGVLAVKLLTEALLGGGFMPRGPGWESLPAAHYLGAAMGAVFAPFLAPRKLKGASSLS